MSTRARWIGPVLALVALVMTGCQAYEVSVVRRDTGAPETQAIVKIAHTKGEVTHTSRVMKLDEAGQAVESIMHPGAVVGEGSTVTITIMPGGELPKGATRPEVQYTCATPARHEKLVCVMVQPPTDAKVRAFFQNLNVWIERK